MLAVMKLESTYSPPTHELICECCLTMYP
uniref:Uncharacterized protein n=1 Tax=Arundo donax TaxID=35708 RepID=A0A0A9EIH0_ARUDO